METILIVFHQRQGEDLGIKIYSQQTPTFKVVPIDHT